MIKYKQRGIALAVTLIILVVLVVFGLTLGTLGIVNLKKVKSFEYSTAALYAAKAGIAKSIYAIYSTPGWNTGFNGESLTSAPGIYTITFCISGSATKYQSTNNINGSSSVTNRTDGITVPAGYCYIISKGTVNGFNKYVAVMASGSSNPPWNYALFGYDSVEVGGSGVVTGDIGTNTSSLIISGSGVVTGDTDINAGQSKPAVTDPLASSPLSGGVISTTQTLPPGKYTSISIPSGKSYTITLSAGTYSFDSVDIANKGKIEILSGPVYVYVSSSMKLIGGDGVINTSHDASRCIFYGTSTCTYVEMRGGSEAYYGIYAPYAAIDFRGGGVLHGSAIGKTAVSSGNSSVTYDSNLSSLSGSTLPQIQSWHLVY